MRSAIDVARGEDVDHLLADLSPGNAPMRELLVSEGFTLAERDGVLQASLAVR